MTEQETSGPSTRPFWCITWAYALIVIIGAIWLGYFDPKGELLDPNEWGDVLAGIFSPLAFLWLIYASLSQKAELALQRKELRTNNRTQKQQREALEAQASYMDQQVQAATAQLRLMSEQIDATQLQVKQLEAETSAKYEPIIVLESTLLKHKHGGVPSTALDEIRLRNIGGNVIDTTFDQYINPYLCGNRRIHTGMMSHWMQGEIASLKLTKDAKDLSKHFEFKVRMRRLDGMIVVHTYQFVGDFEQIHLTDRSTQ